MRLGRSLGGYGLTRTVGGVKPPAAISIRQPGQPTDVRIVKRHSDPMGSLRNRMKNKCFLIQRAARLPARSPTLPAGALALALALSLTGCRPGAAGPAATQGPKSPAALRELTPQQRAVLLSPNSSPEEKKRVQELMRSR